MNYHILHVVFHKRRLTMGLFSKKNKEPKKIMTTVILGTCVCGLPFPDGTEIGIEINNDGFIFRVDKNREAKLSIEKITDIQDYDETVIENIVTSSTSSTIIGAAAFGAIGAIIGSRPKSKRHKEDSYFIVIDYDDKQIIVKTKSILDLNAIMKKVKRLRPDLAEKKQIEL